ncbi:MAG: BrxA/BrxB family bacilliredoxin [Flavobacteriia bacterium]|nr:BrxA/BrxB family bacilliredoxin [Flavobacteriia bacterium]
MYPEHLVMPMKADLVQVGFKELTTPDSVDEAIKNSIGSSLLLVVNSVCGCAAGNLRPGVKLSLQTDKKPSHITTVFAGFDIEAVAQARTYFAPYPPSSPCVALFKDGKLVHFLERHNIEGISAQLIAENLQEAYKEFC